MKCPKCGYLGFETTDRCRNCQYDFSLSPLSSDPDLTLRPDHDATASADFELQAISPRIEAPRTNAFDLDRLFGELPSVRGPGSTPVASQQGSGAKRQAPEGPPDGPSIRHAVEPDAVDDSDEFDAGSDSDTVADIHALPFDEGPQLPPRPARPPLAVRRAVQPAARTRQRTTRPVRRDTPLGFDPTEPPASEGQSSAEFSETVTRAPARAFAAIIDLVLLAGIDAGVVFLTLRMAGLEATVTDLRAILVAPFVGFLGLLAFGYVASFTVAGGQTVGKMLLRLRVVADDGRPVDAAGGVLRAVGCMLVPLTLGLSYLPALFGSDHRALHDRLAGTRVVNT